MEIPKGGEIIYSFATEDLPSHFDYMENNCEVWRNINNRVGNETHPDCSWDAAEKAFRVTNFDKIEKMTDLAI